MDGLTHHCFSFEEICVSFDSFLIGHRSWRVRQHQSVHLKTILPKYYYTSLWIYSTLIISRFNRQHKKIFFLQTLLEWSSETNQIIPLQNFQLADSYDSKLKNKPSKRNEFHKIQTIRFHIWNWPFHVWKDRTDRWKESDFNSKHNMPN